MKNFWEKLNKPLFVLAPMADVTDCAFRQIIAKYGKPDVFWTEFVSADGLAHPVAREKLLIDLRYSVDEHPIVAQIFGGKPENIKSAAALCKELGFDGIDINMGCPDKSIEKQCAGAAMMKDLDLAKRVIQSAKDGARSTGSGQAGDLPISVKTRIGYNKNEVDTWIRGLLEQDLAVLTVHLRSRKEMSDVPAHWEVMKDIVKLRDEMGKNTLIIGNGDVLNLEDAKEKIKETGCDGVMFGRAIFGNPWLFSNTPHPPPSPERGRGSLSFQERVGVRLRVMIEHTKLYEKMLGGHKNFTIMKKHYKAYVNGFDGAKELRVKLMEAENATEIENIVNDFLADFLK